MVISNSSSSSMTSSTISSESAPISSVNEVERVTCSLLTPRFSQTISITRSSTEGTFYSSQADAAAACGALAAKGPPAMVAKAAGPRKRATRQVSSFQKPAPSYLPQQPCAEQGKLPVAQVITKGSNFAHRQKRQDTRASQKRKEERFRLPNGVNAQGKFVGEDSAALGSSLGN